MQKDLIIIKINLAGIKIVLTLYYKVLFNLYQMKEEKEHLQAISEMRSMMERSSRFISLSGLSGVFAGVFALVGTYLAHEKLRLFFLGEVSYVNIRTYLFMIAALVLVFSVSIGVFLTIRNSKKKGINIWDNTSRRLIINMMIPLITGGLFCLILLYHENVGLIAPATLIFYGLSLINASKYTLNDIRYLGICEIVLGLIASFYIGYGLYFWALGFGILHIVYGTVMYFKYERS